MGIINRTIVATLALATAPLLAQSEQSEQKQQQQSPTEQRSEKSQQELKVSKQDAKKQVTDANRASKLIGMHVKNKQGEDLGKIKDVVLDFQSGKVAYVALSFGGTLGMGQRMLAIPIEALTSQEAEKGFVIDLPKQQIAHAPGFDERNWPDLNAAEKGQTIGLAKSQSAETNAPEAQATGGTGPQAQESSGKGSSAPAPITSLQQLTSASDPSAFQAKDAKISSARVQEVFGKDAFLVSSGDSGKPVLVKSEKPVENVEAGKTVSFSGKVEAMPSDPSQLGLDQSSAQKISGQKFYIRATEVTASP